MCNCNVMFIRILIVTLCFGVRAVPLINLWGAGRQLFSAVPPSGIMPVAVGPPCRSVMLTTPQPSRNTLTQLFLSGKGSGKSLLFLSFWMD